ncbi:MAG: serine/threonine protein kinase [Planctomycetes bacterium]|nr:serine/threonine protein kinase [Planctomycetota bacterium]
MSLDERSGAAERDPVEALVEEYFDRRRRGEPVALDSFARRAAAREEEFRSLVETFELLESAASGAPRSGGASARALAAGDRLGRFRLIRPIGRGGMGVVWEAFDEELQRTVALKLLPGVASLDPRDVERFRREALAAARLHHPRIVPIHAVGEAGGTHWIAMQFIAGESLERRLRRSAEGRAADELPAAPAAAPLDAVAIARHGAALADALAYAHGEGILHRDVKPSNVLLDESGAAWITDFGLAKADGSDSITRTDELVGTPRYMAPEAFAGWADPRTDVWGLGATLYEALARRPAFDGGDRARLLKQIHDVEPPALRRLDPALPRDLATIVHKCLQKEPAARYASARELAEDLERCVAGRPIRARPPSLAYRAALVLRRHPVAAALLAAALLAGAGATWREALRARAAESQSQRRYQEVRKLAGDFLFECHDAIRHLPGSTAARALIAKRSLAYLDALAKERGHDPQEDAELRRELSLAYQKVGDVLGNPYQPNVGDMAGARASYAAAIALLEPIVAAGAGSDEDRALLATALLVGGGIDLVAGATEQALARSARGIALRDALAQAAGDRARRLDLATAWQFHAYNLAAAGRRDEARAAIDRQAALLDELAAEPGGAEDLGVQRGRAKNRYLLAYHLAGAGAPAADRARAAYAEAVDLQRRLVAADPTNTSLARDLAWTLNDQAIFVKNSGDLAGAIAIYREVLERCEALARGDAESVDATLGVVRAHHNLSGALKASGAIDAALHHGRAALAACEPAVAADPSNPYAERLLARACLNVGGLALLREGAAALDEEGLFEAAALSDRSLQILERHAAAGLGQGDATHLIAQAREQLEECRRRRAALTESRR